MRQAGALRGVSLFHHYTPTEETQVAVMRGLAFFDQYSREVDGKKWILYPGDRRGDTGTVSLLTLALIEFLRSDDAIPDREQYEKDLDMYINFLLSLRTQDGQFYSSYDLTTGEGQADPSPYFDGETLLALVKAAKYL